MYYIKKYNVWHYTIVYLSCIAYLSIKFMQSIVHRQVVLSGWGGGGGAQGLRILKVSVIFNTVLHEVDQFQF